MTEKLIQLGLSGFGKETPAQLKQAEQTKAIEIDRETFVVPLKTTVYRSSNPELGMVVVEPFYIKKKETSKVIKGLVRVTVASSDGVVYRDGQRVNLSVGEVLEVPVNRLVKKKS